MKKVKIISGAYGQHSGNRVILRSADSEPFELDDAEANRLAALGVAEIIVDSSAANGASDYNDDTPTSKIDVPDDANDNNDNDTPDDDVTDDGDDDVDEVDKVDYPLYSVDSSAADLREIGKTCGLSFRVNMSKADMVAALDKYFANIEPSSDTPDLSASDPV